MNKFGVSTNFNDYPNCLGVYSTQIKFAFNSWNTFIIYLKSLHAERVRSDKCTNKNKVKPYLWFISRNGCIASISRELFNQLPKCQRPKVYSDPVKCVCDSLGVDIPKDIMV